MDLQKQIASLDSRKTLLKHPLIKTMQRGDSLSKEQVGTVLGQWFHPLHYFPSFVSRLIGIFPDTATKTFMSKIVWQELGEGDYSRAHEVIFIDTMTEVGFDEDQLTKSPALQATARLVSEYHDKSANDHLASLGYVYATEAADLVMVSSIGAAVRKTVGVDKLPWVDIHVEQEPDHTDSVDAAVAIEHSESDAKEIVAAADKMFGLWVDFFSGIERELDIKKAA